MNKNTEYTAVITGTGADSMVSDHPGAVDAYIYAGGVLVGEVTLLPNEQGHLDTWGSHLEHWADHRVRAHLSAIDEGRDAMIDAIVDAVRDAAEEVQ